MFRSSERGGGWEEKYKYWEDPGRLEWRRSVQLNIPCAAERLEVTIGIPKVHYSSFTVTRYFPYILASIYHVYIQKRTNSTRRQATTKVRETLIRNWSATDPNVVLNQKHRFRRELCVIKTLYRWEV